MSLSFVRLVESGKSDISLSRLLKWTTLFGLPVADLFTDDDRRELLVVRAEERTEVASRESGVRFLLLSSGADHDMEPAIFELARGAVMQRELRHEGEETAFVLYGEVELRVADQQVLLRQGDNAYYRSDLPHRFGNRGREPAALLVTTTHPRLNLRATNEDGSTPRVRRNGASRRRGTGRTPPL